jgi:hypothetical protein
VYNVVTSLTANIEAERTRQGLTESELRNEDRKLRERIARLESCIDTFPLSPIRRSSTASFRLNDQGDQGGKGIAEAVDEVTTRLQDAVTDVSKRMASLEAGMGPVDGIAAKEYSLELKQHTDRIRDLEEQLENFQKQLAHRLSTQEEMTSMRLDTIEREILSCVRPADLDSLRNQIDNNGMRLERDLPERIRLLGLDLQSDLQSRIGNFQKDLKAISDAVDAKLQVFDDQLEAICQAGSSGGSAGAKDASDEGGASSAQIAIATGKLSREIVDLENRIRDVESMHGQNLDGRVTELERIAAQGLQERRRESAVDVDGASVKESGMSGSRVDSHSLSPSAHRQHGGQEFEELATRVDGALDGISKRLQEVEQQVAGNQAEEPPSNLASGYVAGTSDLPQLADLAKKMDTSLDDMGRRIIALEEGGLLVGHDQPLSTEEAKRLVAEAAAEAAEACRTPPESLLTEFSNRMDALVNDVQKRVGNLEKKVGAIQELEPGDPTAAPTTKDDRVVTDDGPRPEALLGELAAHVDAQMDALHRKIAALEQLAEQQRLARPMTPQEKELATRLSEVEQTLTELKSSVESGGQSSVPGAVPPNILDGLHHEMESAKARIELQLGQDLDVKTAAVEQRLTQTVSVHETRVTGVENALKAMKDSGGPEIKCRDLVFEGASQEPQIESRDLVVESTTVDEIPATVPMDEFNSLSDKVQSMEQRLQQAIAAAASATASAAAVPAVDGKAELEKQMEDRMTAMWKELLTHSKTAEIRADGLEMSLLSRIQKIESSVLTSLQSGGAQKSDLKAEMNKSLEWMNWRISWLEWATNGEKRSFGRSVDAKALLPSPPPQTIAAAAFSQPQTEDMELWARDKKSGQMRLRRDLRPQPQGFADASLGPLGPTATSLKGSASLGRLPRLTQ